MILQIRTSQSSHFTDILEHQKSLLIDKQKLPLVLNARHNSTVTKAIKPSDGSSDNWYIPSGWYGVKLPVIPWYNLAFLVLDWNFQYKFEIVKNTLI